jgi:hypothetical protein
VILAGPDVRYRVAGGLETNGADAVLHLRTVDGLDWNTDRPASEPEPVEVTRRPDLAAREAYAADPVPESLAAARIAIEHVEHHGQPLRFVGSSLVGDEVEHRFACTDRRCRFVLAWSVTE